MSHILEIPGESKEWVLKRHRILGKGSFGCATLYEEVNNSGSFVVVKDINMQIMKKTEEMKALELEVEILRRSCGHPNIVQFLDYYYDGEFMVYIIMEYCELGDLSYLEEKLRHHCTHQSEEFIASILIQMLVGLYYLHVEQNILHRDIKPQNIFLSYDYSIRIGDFGISIILNNIGSVAKEICGSPFYMAPELYEEKSYDGKADIWSLGVMMYELIVLEKPFNAVSSSALKRQIIRGEYNPISRHLPYSIGLIELVESFLQISTLARPTLRRVLRSSYVQSHLECLPLRCLNSVYYKRLFGEEYVQSAIKKKERHGSPEATSIFSDGYNDFTMNQNNNNNNNSSNNRDDTNDNRNNRLSSCNEHKIDELEMWLKANGDVKDAFIMTAKVNKCCIDGGDKVSLSSHMHSGETGGHVVMENMTEFPIRQSQLPPSLNPQDEGSDELYEDDFESEDSD